MRAWPLLGSIYGLGLALQHTRERRPARCCFRLESLCSVSHQRPDCGVSKKMLKLSAVLLTP